MEGTATYARLKERGGPVPVSTKLYQGTGSWPDTFKNFAFNTFLLFYYSQVLGIPASLASLAMGIALVMDAVSDPVVGSFSDNLRSRLGRRHPLMYAAALPLAFSLWGTFAPPGRPGRGRALLLAAVLHDLDARGAHVLPGPVERHVRGVHRRLCRAHDDRHLPLRPRLGRRHRLHVPDLVVHLPGDRGLPHRPVEPGRLPGVRAGARPDGRARGPVHDAHDAPGSALPLPAGPGVPVSLPGRAARGAARPLENRNFLRIFMAVLIGAVIAGTAGAFDLYMATYFWGFSGEDLRWLAFAVIGAIAAFGAVYPLQRRYDKRTLLVGGLVLNMFFGMLFVSLRLLDVLPANGEPLLLVLYLVNATVRVAIGTVLGIAFVSMLADTLDDQELDTGRRQEGVFSSAISFSAKATRRVRHRHRRVHPRLRHPLPARRGPEPDRAGDDRVPGRGRRPRDAAPRRHPDLPRREVHADARAARGDSAGDRCAAGG